MLDDLHQLPAALLGELWEREPDELAVVGRVDAEIRVLNGFLDGLQRVLVIGLDDQQAGFGHVEAGQLLERHLSAVVVDLELLDERRGRPTRAHARELGLRMADGLRHLVGRLDENVVDHVPITGPAYRSTRPRGRAGCSPAP